MGRGYPDVTLMGSVSFSVFIGGVLSEIGGTSASTPVFAAMVTLVNSHRLKNGLGTLGWINPSLYTYYEKFGHDIVSGNNLCTESKCCNQGFFAAQGW